MKRSSQQDQGVQSGEGEGGDLLDLVILQDSAETETFPC